ncbi:hypothetical protein PATSB16_28300 [Pandoraea thiooxydans]|nr:hypothetical protein PATSB16_28300 [Pandoraea thiooxydans]
MSPTVFIVRLTHHTGQTSCVMVDISNSICDGQELLAPGYP